MPKPISFEKLHELYDVICSIDNFNNEAHIFVMLRDIKGEEKKNANSCLEVFNNFHDSVRFKRLHLQSALCLSYKINLEKNGKKLCQKMSLT
jgi:hypothetical protein